MAQPYAEAPDSQDSVSASKRSLIAALVLIVGYMLAGVIGGYFAGSLALLAHAGHMLADAVSLGLGTSVVTEGCRGIDLVPGDVQRAWKEMREAGVKVVGCENIG